MLVVGLTGGIGSGKSAVAACFAALGVPVIDADTIAHALVAPGMPALARIVEVFGPALVNHEGALERARLRAIIFQDRVRRKQLEAILHPLIRQEMAYQVARLSSPYCVLCIPLLLETDARHQVQRVLVVDTPHYLQYWRVMAREAMTSSEVAAIIRTQVRFRERLAKADDIIVNDRDRASLQGQVEQLHRHYGDLARQGLPAQAK